MIKRILIANRGEIALRIVRACKELNIESVAIHSEVDRYALHVKRATQAHCIGGNPVDAYLNIHRIIDVAKSFRVDAIHPGYGFLSENPEFAKACEQAGIVFIGPSAQVIQTMGSKVAARDAMKKANIPVIPGSAGNLDSLEDACELAKKIGYPVILKATFGGGGRGIRLCQDEEVLRNAYGRVQSEAQKAFGNAQLFMEKFVLNPRHIEVQILADNFGHVIHLFERDCSIQRRHQKLIEIAPSPQIELALRKKICDFAVRAAKSVNYQNAGTVEFLLDKDDTIYFLEMNTRLQVEHPITEQITGVDLVQQQILCAQGLPLNLNQQDIKMRGYAIEFRVNAEDPKNDFLPSFGKVTRYYAPGGPGVRTDSAIYTGYSIPPDYDSLCAKLTVWNLDWHSTIKRAERALEEMRLFGVKTTISYYLEILKTKAFVEANFDTSFVEQHPQLLQYSDKPFAQHKAAVIATALAAMSRYKKTHH
jgi:pyruvate carboxylase subunit A